MMQAHYTSILDLSNDALLASEKGYLKLMEAISSLKAIEAGSNTEFNVAAWQQKCYDAMNDDFNSPILIAHLFEAVKHINLIKDGKETITKEDKELLENTLNTFVFDILGLTGVNEDANGNSEKLEEVVNLLIQLRNDARSNKDFALSDQIRDQLLAMGIQLKDGKDGTTFSVS